MRRWLAAAAGVVLAAIALGAQGREFFDFGYGRNPAIRNVPYDGRFIVRGGKTELLEGEQEPKRIVVLEFPTVEKAKQWWNSEEYAPAKKIRQANSSTRMFVVEGT